MAKINKYKEGDIVICPKFMGNRQGRIIRFFKTSQTETGCQIEYEVLFVNNVLETFFEKWLEKVDFNEKKHSK